jgi:hypothetical protein
MWKRHVPLNIGSCLPNCTASRLGRHCCEMPVLVQGSGRQFSVAATGDDMQQLSNSHSSSTDSGIQSVCGDEAAITTSSLIPYESLVQQCFGGRLLISFKCLECQAESVHTDHFRDIQLAFPPGCSPDHELHIQVLEPHIVPHKTYCLMSFTRYVGSGEGVLV